ncbi:MAG: hypothetical protein QOG99_3589 [Frankiales bacterium]|jgi:hypothetical protein|nr:hypothetical protein [Frankiales bacterium]
MARGSSPRRRRTWRVIGALLAVFLLVVGVSITRSLTAPGTDSTAARLAEWARGHWLSAVVDRLERVTYHAPKVGGTPAATSPLVATTPDTHGQVGLQPIRPLATPALPGEGAWHVLKAVGGRPVLQAAFLRPDAVHTSYTAAVAWMDPTRVRFVLHPGTQEPGHGPWSVGSSISLAERPTLLAAFNGGFRIDAARGGFLEGGHHVGALRVGAASFVVLPNGRATVGQWGRDVGPGTALSAVSAVRQNLDLLVDKGTPAAGLDANTGGRWGRTLGNKFYVWRSGVGVTRSGALVYVAGNRLSAGSLAELLVRAGCVRAMELDINPEWTSFITYSPGHAQNLLPDMQRSPHRYDTTSTRDFVTVSLGS